MEKDHVEAWGNCLKVIKDNIALNSYKTWFEPIVPIKLENNILTIQVPSHFFYEWLEEHYVKLLKVALTKELGPGAKLLYKIKMENTYGNKLNGVDIGKGKYFSGGSANEWSYYYSCDIAFVGTIGRIVYFE